MRLIASREGRDGSVRLNQAVDLYAATLAPGESITHALLPGRHAWIQVATGQITVGGEPLAAGDGAAITDVPIVRIEAHNHAELLLFDLP